MTATLTSLITHPISWPSARRKKAFCVWLEQLAKDHKLQKEHLTLASADASFRRYFRILSSTGDSRIVMDAPPDLEDNATFVRIARVLQKAGLKVPEILAWDEDNGFLLLSDLGTRTLLQGMDTTAFAPNTAYYQEASSMLLRLQSLVQPDALPDYNKVFLLRELQLFPEWYVAAYRQCALSTQETTELNCVFERIIAHNLAAPKVFVHRDFMPRNFILPEPSDTGLGLIDFQGAVRGPVIYDIASLMRDAFHSWDEEHVLDVTVRYWEQARTMGLLDFEDWYHNFGAFWRAVDWMALQRHLKVAGIFARLGLQGQKPRYLADVPRFVRYIRATCTRYHELTPLLRLLDRIENTSRQETPRLDA